MACLRQREIRFTAPLNLPVPVRLTISVTGKDSKLRDDSRPTQVPVRVLGSGDCAKRGRVARQKSKNLTIDRVIEEVVMHVFQNGNTITFVFGDR